MILQEKRTRPGHRETEFTTRHSIPMGRRPLIARRVLGFEGFLSLGEGSTLDDAIRHTLGGDLMTHEQKWIEAQTEGLVL